MPILCTFTDTQKCQSNQSTTVAACLDLRAARIRLRLRQLECYLHKRFLASVSPIKYSFLFRCSTWQEHAPITEYVQVCKPHTHKSGIKSSCFERCQAVCTCKHIQQVNELEFKCRPLRAMSLRKYLQHPSAKFHTKVPTLAVWQPGKVESASMAPEFCAPKTAGA